MSRESLSSSSGQKQQQPASHAKDLEPLLDKGRTDVEEKGKSAASNSHLVAALVYGEGAGTGCRQPGC
jgi:hypothetical protein